MGNSFLVLSNLTSCYRDVPTTDPYKLSPLEKYHVIRTKTHQAIAHDDLGEMAFRYLQSRKGQKRAALGLKPLSSLPLNTLSKRYQELKKLVKSVMIDKLRPGEFDKIAQLSYSKQGLRKLALLFAENNMVNEALFILSKNRIHFGYDPVKEIENQDAF